jgi:hypothetical protein
MKQTDYVSILMVLKNRVENTVDFDGVSQVSSANGHQHLHVIFAYPTDSLVTQMYWNLKDLFIVHTLY